MLESKLERRLTKQVNKMGGWALKFNSGIAGVPDRLILLPNGRALFVEMKATGKDLRALQKKRKRQLENLGFKVYKIDSDEAIDGFIRDVRTLEI
ncbi:MAG: VRR-NUC domain-containing protein [Weizmannia coagulans]|nr:VRR-NUC domain-containing protein [Heyndrickxia coagulans]